MEQQFPLYYFGFGPIINPIVQKRRGLQVTEQQGAMLPEHRLIFSLGVVNAIKQTGYEIYGVLMKVNHEEDWKKMVDMDSCSDLDEVYVYPMKKPDEAVLAKTMIFKDYRDRGKFDRPADDKLPQERYLRLIANGMRKYKIDPEYIEDQIMGVDFEPTVKPENYKTVPLISDPLPKITYERYQSLCSSNEGADTYVIIGKKVIKIVEREYENPCIKWSRKNGFGKPDMTLYIHLNIIDPDMPMVDTAEELTPAHFAWAENFFCYIVENSNLNAVVMYELCAPGEEGPRILFPSWCLCCKK